LPTVHADGCDFFYCDDDFVEGWIPHDCAFLLPYVFGDTEAFRPWIPTLARRMRTIRLDRRGSGMSTKPPVGYEFTVEGFVRDAVQVLDRLGIERVHYIGDSLGGIIGIALAALHPE
jgi:pimeloyl-ACP methyl ester carboxylesterase